MKKSKKLILLSGKKRTGKDTVADYLVKQYNFESRAFANKLRGYAYQFLHYFLDYEGAPQVVYNDTLKDIPITNKCGLEIQFKNEALTPRKLLQYLGTDVFRDNFDSDFWVNKVITSLQNHDFVNNFVITDCRFPNEIDKVKDELENFYNITSIRIHRNTGLHDTHLSETALDDYTDFDYVIENNGTLEELYQKVDRILWT